MSKGSFTDHEHRPTMEEIFTSLGSRRKAWDELNQYMLENYHVTGELLFGGVNYGWALRFRKSGKTLLTLFPRQRGFVANVVIGRSFLGQAQALKLGENARQVLDSAKRFHEGCWLYVKVRSKQDILDIQQLVALKLKPRPVRKGTLTAKRAVGRP